MARLTSILAIALFVGASAPACDGSGGATGTPDMATATSRDATTTADTAGGDTSAIDGGADGDATGGCVPGDPGCPAIGELIPGEWTLVQPRFVVQPGTRLELELTRVDATPDEIVLWRDDGEWLPPFAVWVEEEGGELASLADDTVIVEVLVPYLQTGPRTLELGTREGPLTGAARIEVILPTEVPDQAQVAAILRDGMVGWSNVLGDILESDDPALQEFLDATYSPQEVAELTQLVAVIRDVGRIVHEDYTALSPEDHQIAATLLKNAGVLDQFATAAYGQGIGGAGVVLFGDTILHPVHRMLIETDYAAMIANVADGALNAVQVISIVSGAGAPVGAIAAGLDMGLTLLRVIIDGVIPTDLAGLEVVEQSAIYEDEGANTTIWGTFETEKPSAEGTVEGIVLLVAKAGILESGSGKGEAVADLIAQVIERILPDLAEALDIQLSDSRRRLKTPINVYPYKLTLGDFATLVPMIGETIRLLTLFVDIVFVDAVDFAEASLIPSWAEGMDVLYGYDGDLLSVGDVPDFPDGVTEFPVRFEVSAYAWKAGPFDLADFLDLNGYTFAPGKYLPFDIPRWASVTTQFQTVVRDRSAGSASVEDFVITTFEVYLGGGESSRDWVISAGDELRRRHTVLFTEQNLNAINDPTTKLRVTLNGEVLSESLGPSSTTARPCRSSSSSNRCATCSRSRSSTGESSPRRR